MNPFRGYPRLAPSPFPTSRSSQGTTKTIELRQRMQHLMTENVGVFRIQSEMDAAVDEALSEPA